MRKFSSIVIIACVLSICCVCYAQEDIEPEGRFNYTCDCKVTDGITGVPAIYKGVASFSEDHFFMMSVEIPGYLVISPVFFVPFGLFRILFYNGEFDTHALGFSYSDFFYLQGNIACNYAAARALCSFECNGLTASP